MSIEKSTKTRAIEEAKNLIQIYGFNGFSFQNIAEKLSIKAPSLYTHFKSKELLGNDLIEEYINVFVQWTETIDIFAPEDKIKALFEIYYKFSQKDKKLCPVSALTSDYNVLPESMKNSLTKMINIHNDWLKKVIEEGQNKHVFREDLSSEILAELVMALGFGSQQMSRAFADPEKIRIIKEQTVNILKG